MDTLVFVDGKDACAICVQLLHACISVVTAAEERLRAEVMRLLIAVPDDT